MIMSIVYIYFCFIILIGYYSDGFISKFTKITFKNSFNMSPQDNSKEELDAVEIAMNYLNYDETGLKFLRKIVTADPKLKKEMDRANFWQGQSFVIKNAQIIGIVKEGLIIDAECDIRDKLQTKRVQINFPETTLSESELKKALYTMAFNFECMDSSAKILKLNFGDNYDLPTDLLFNQVPHPAWVRSYIYDAVTTATKNAVFNIDNIGSFTKSRLSVYVNFPEVNPAFDTYRIGTMLEMVRNMALGLVEEEGLKIRICVQQSMGSGIFTGLPLAIASMRPILERMDWAGVPYGNENVNSVIRFGTVGPDEIKDDDDCIIVVAPQNIVGGCVIDYLQPMCSKAEGKNIPLIAINPMLNDRPSSDNQMQIRGRAERQEFAKSFHPIFHMKLLYPSNGGYMFPIRGQILKRGYDQPWVLYDKKDIPVSDVNGNSGSGSNSDGKGRKEEYQIIAAFPPDWKLDSKVVSAQYVN